MNLPTYQEQSLRTAEHGRAPDLRIAVAGMGLCGEAAEVLEVVLEAPTETPCDLTWPHRLVKELGDVAWYVAELASSCELRLVDAPDTLPDKTRVQAAMHLVLHAGALTDHLKKAVGHGHALDVKLVDVELRHVLAAVATIARTAGSDLQDVCEQNVAKLAARYPTGFNSRDSIRRADG